MAVYFPFIHKVLLSLPEESIIFDKDDSYIFIQSTFPTSPKDRGEIIFIKTKVIKGRSDHGRIQILNESVIGMNSSIVIKGANYLKSKMGKGEGDDD